MKKYLRMLSAAVMIGALRVKAVLHLKYADGMANSVDPDQASSGTV